jgi:hypothetical protein
MRPLRLGIVAIATAALLAACGSSAGQIPIDSANTLHGDLTAVDTAFLNGECATASAALATAQIDFYNLLSTVNQKLASQLERGLSTLSHDEQSQCRRSSSTGGSTTGTGSSGQTGQTGSTGTTSSTSTSSSTTSSTTTSSTSTSTTGSATTGVTGPTCTSTTGGNGGTPACDGSTSPSGIGGGGIGGGTGTGAASVGN